MNEKQVKLVRHAIGLDGRSKVTYRNHFCVGREGEDHSDWDKLVESGLATARRNVQAYGGMDIFCATREAATMVLRDGERLEADFTG